MGWVSRSLAVLAAVLCLSMLPSASPRAQTAATLLSPYAQLQAEMTDLRAEANGLYIKTYYCPPPKEPMKREDEAAVDAMKARAQALQTRYEALKAELRAQALSQVGGPQFAAAGVDPNNRHFFDAGDQLLASVFAEIAKREAELAKAPTRPCKEEAPPEPPKKLVRVGPLSPAEEGILSTGFPLAVPAFDDPVTLPKPPRFCTFAERTAWLKEVFWPTVERAKENALKAIDAHGRAEDRLRAVRRAHPDDADLIALAERSVEAWRQEKDRRQAEHRKILDTDTPNPVDCTKPEGEIIGIPPVTEHPDGTLTFNRPQLIWPLSIPPLPPCFMSEEARHAYMNEVYFPLLDKVNENGQRRADYMWKLSEALRGILARYGSASAQYKAAEAEYNAYDAERKRAQAFHDQVAVDFYNRIQTLPICSFEPPKETGVVPGGGGTPPKLVAPSLNRPQFERVPDVAIPRKFCTAQERNAWMKEVYDPAMAAALKNAKTAQDHLAKLNAMFTQYMRANSEHWAAVRAERDAFEPIAAEATARAEALRQAYDRIMAVPIIPCGQPDGKPLEVIPGVGPGDRIPCPPTQTGDASPCPRQGRQPINVGPNGKVGSGAQLKSKLGGMAIGALAGALGGGGGGGGGGSDGPDLWTCKIKDSEMTVFTDPASGVSLQIGAKRAKGDKLVIFSKIAKSPDKGTFQTAFLEKPSTAEVIAPSEVGPCDLWGEWKLTVSWTKDTYVDNELVKHEEGGWSEGGLFSVPGMLSKSDAPTGLWKQMGFSNASNGAREMGTIFNLPPGQGPLTFVIHVTRPKADPVTTVPFVLTMTEGPGGTYSFTKAEEDPCPKEAIPVSDAPKTQVREAPPAVPAEAPPSTPSTATSPPASGGARTFYQPQPRPAPSSNLPDEKDAVRYMNVYDLSRAKALVQLLDDRSKEQTKALETARCEGPDAWQTWRAKRLERLKDDIKVLQEIAPIGRDRDAIQSVLNDQLVRMAEEVLDIEAMKPPEAATSCPLDDNFESILDSLPEEIIVPS